MKSNWLDKETNAAGFNSLSSYIAWMNGYQPKKEVKKMKTEKILNISLILNASLSIAVALLSVVIFVMIAYGAIGIYN